jgi:hypothetical protein
MSRNKSTDLKWGGDAYQKDSKGIFIVLTTNDTEGQHGGWDDHSTVWEIKKRLRAIMNVLPTKYGGVPFPQIDELVDSRVHFKRTGVTTDKKDTLYSHSKIVCVDRRLMYVGSDNAYPCYNEEHGVWMGDSAKIGGWLDDFFVPYWKECKTPDDLVEPKKA